MINLIAEEDMPWYEENIVPIIKNDDYLKLSNINRCNLINLNTIKFLYDNSKYVDFDTSEFKDSNFKDILKCAIDLTTKEDYRPILKPNILIMPMSMYDGYNLSDFIKLNSNKNYGKLGSEYNNIDVYITEDIDKHEFILAVAPNLGRFIYRCHVGGFDEKE